MSLGQNIHDIRRKKGWTQAQLASGICDRTLISRIESGNVVPSVEIIKQLAEKLGAPNLLFELAMPSERKPSLSLTSLRSLMRHQRFEEAFNLGASLFWAYNECGAVGAMKQVIDILQSIPNKQLHNESLQSELSTLLFQSLRHRDCSVAFEIGVHLIKCYGEAQNYPSVVATTRGLLALGPPNSVAITLLIALGTATFRLKKPIHALTAYESALDLSHNLHNRHEKARALHGLSACSLSLSDTKNALRYASEACSLYAMDHELYWLARQNGGIAQILLGDIQQGRHTLAECHHFWTERGNISAILSVEEDMARLM
ncbi:helix-turn-helix domain-containing protein [Sulfobacillus thermosulfidooxidans]|uniref:helix-turn-helix domain-containing protein n=1 Tax=Sulfobacillus thermosulfidooxidans TaxID=28034 RepID=UPI0002D4DD9E|nr:helix-turn-helix transcriptional regulator [Sulfobacillus thermosulfidooxidans]